MGGITKSLWELITGSQNKPSPGNSDRIPLAAQPGTPFVNEISYVTVAQLASVITPGGTVITDPTRGIDGNGSLGNPIFAKVDGVTIVFDGSGQLKSVGGSGTVVTDPNQGVDGDGSIGDPIVAKVDGTTIGFDGSGNLQALASGGAAISTTAFGAEPGSPATGDVDLYSNSPQIARYSGAAWVPWGPIFPFTAPISGDYAWINQGGAAISTVNGGVSLTAPTGADSARIRKKARPVGTYSIVIGYIPTLVAAGGENAYCGFVWRQASDGKLVTFHCESRQSDNRGTQLASYKWDSPTSVNSSYGSWCFGGAVPMIFLKLSDDGAFRRLYFSGDGINFVLLNSQAFNDFITADEVGFFATGTGGLTSAMMLLHWKEN